MDPVPPSGASRVEQAHSPQAGRRTILSMTSNGGSMGGVKAESPGGSVRRPSLSSASREAHAKKVQTLLNDKGKLIEHFQKVHMFTETKNRDRGSNTRKRSTLRKQEDFSSFESVLPSPNTRHRTIQLNPELAPDKVRKLTTRMETWKEHAVDVGKERVETVRRITQNMHTWKNVSTNIGKERVETVKRVSKNMNIWKRRATDVGKGAATAQRRRSSMNMSMWQKHVKSIGKAAIMLEMMKPQTITYKGGAKPANYDICKGILEKSPYLRNRKVSEMGSGKWEVKWGGKWSEAVYNYTNNLMPPHFSYI